MRMKMAASTGINRWQHVTVRNHVTNPFPFSIRTFCYRALSHLGARVQALDAVPFSLKHSYYLTAFRYSLSYLHVIDWT